MNLGEIIKAYRDKTKMSMEMFSEKTGISKGYISMLEKNKNPKNGKPITPSLETIKSVANIVGLEINELLQMLDNEQEFIINDIDPYQYDNVMPITTHKIPLLGEIACGEPIFAQEDRESYIEAGTEIKADFCLRAKGDSMIGARILDGDIVFIRKQSIVDNGEIAAIIIDDEVTLKRVYYYTEEKTIKLMSENPNYKPIVYTGNVLDQIRILGKAIYFQSDVR